MDLAGTLISAAYVLLVVVGEAWSHVRKIGKICSRLDILSRNYGDLITALNKLNGRVQDLERTVLKQIKLSKTTQGGN